MCERLWTLPALGKKRLARPTINSLRATIWASAASEAGSKPGRSIWPQVAATGQSGSVDRIAWPQARQSRTTPDDFADRVAAFRGCAGRDDYSRSSNAFLPTADTRDKMAMTVWRTGAWSLQIVKRSDAAGFEALPKRWIVERTFTWISRNRRLARDFERYATTDPPRHDPRHAQATCCKCLAMKPNFPDGLLVYPCRNNYCYWGFGAPPRHACPRRSPAPTR